MFSSVFRKGLLILTAGAGLASSSALAQPVAVETVCFPSPSGNGPVWYSQAFFWGGYQYPAGGYNGGPYRPRAYSAADVYISPPVCFSRTLYRERGWRGTRVAHRHAHRRHCVCATR